MDLFDFNGDGRTDAGEAYTAFRIFEDCTGDSGVSGPRFACRGGRISGFDIFIIALVVYAALNTICSLLYG